MLNAQLALRIYGWLTGLSGLVILGFGLGDATWFGTSLLTVVVGSILISAGCWAASLSQLVDPSLRRKGLMWFSAAHLNVVLIGSSMRTEIWGHSPAPFEQLITIAGWTVISFLMGRTAALAVANAKEPSSPYERQMREAGAMEERNRLARDLHDSIKQQIFVIQTAAATAQTRFDSDRAGAATALDQIRDSARDAMTEMEVMMDNLRSVPLENTGLVEALKKQCEALGHRTGAKVEFQLGELPPNEAVPPGAHQAVFRVAQEALANIGRHARASNVTVSLGLLKHAKGLELRIQDDGTGFDPSQSSAGMGLANMRARAGDFGGRLDLTSGLGQGTVVAFYLPCKAVMPPPSKRRKLLVSLWLTVVVGSGAGMLALKGHREGNDLFAYFFVGVFAFATVRAYFRRRA